MMGVPAALLAAGLALQSPADSYQDRYAEVRALRPLADRAAQVTDLVLTRDVGRFTLRTGTLYLLSPVGGRTVGAVFRGQGTFAFTPPSRIEQDRLFYFERMRALETPFNELVLLFADTTLAELERRLQFGTALDPGSLAGFVRNAVSFLGDDESQSFDPDFMAAFLNGESADLFYAHINRTSGSLLMFMVNPHEAEAVTLGRPAPSMGLTSRRDREVVCQFPREGAPTGSVAVQRPGTATISAYALDVTLAQTFSGDLSFAARGRIEVTSTAPVGPWIPFQLFSQLKVDSARTDDGRAVPVFQGKEAEQMWLRLDQRLAPGETRPVTLYYRGDLIDRFGDFFYIKTSIAWYPRSLEGRSYATFDITYHSPSHYLIASVGERTDSTVNGQVLTTRWVSSSPIRNASFNLGQFEDYWVREEGLPPIGVMVSERAHRQMAQAMWQQRRMKETVGADLAQSMKFFSQVYGPPPVSRFHATEIPYFHGEAFPGMVNLSWVTFLQTDTQGEDEVFRAHEMAHQWWGIGVDFASYHDQWLSEGFANFSGLWYLHAVRRASDKYFGILRRWRANIFEKRDDPSPIWLGYRTSSSKDAGSYSVLVYQKGAWVLHMLRIMMLELRTANEDRFTGMMTEFYHTYRGRRASTEDFQRMVEKHIGMPMDWFFNQWVYGWEIPTYRVAYKTDRTPEGQYRVTLRVTQENVGESFQMYVPVTVDLGQNREGRFRIKVQGRESEIPLPLLPTEPRRVTFNALEGVLGEVRMVGW